MSKHLPALAQLAAALSSLGDHAVRLRLRVRVRVRVRVKVRVRVRDRDRFEIGLEKQGRALSGVISRPL